MNLLYSSITAPREGVKEREGEGEREREREREREEEEANCQVIKTYLDAFRFSFCSLLI